jgi:hypothetical protein
MNKGLGTTFGFLLILLVLGLGFYVALTSFRSTRAAILAQPTLTPRPATSTPRPTTAATSTYTPIPTPIPGITLTQTATALPSPTATVKGANPTKTPKPKKTVTPVPPTATVPEVSSYAFRLAGPPSPEHEVSCCYVVGTVRDAAGNGIPGVLVKAFNEWIQLPPSETKAGGEAGQYDIPLGMDKVTWYVLVVDANGNPLSPQASLAFDPAVAPRVRVDWNKTK